MAVDCKVKAVKKFLARQRSVSSTASSDPQLKDSDIGGADPDAEPAALGKSGLTRIFFDACRFGEVLEHDADADADAGSVDGTQETEADSLESPLPLSLSPKQMPASLEDVSA